jgi:hypothetical protein
MDIELEPPNVFSAIRFLGLQTQVIFVIQLLMTLHRHPEWAIIVMSAPSIYIYEIQIKVNNKKVFAFSYILYFLLKKKVHILIMTAKHIPVWWRPPNAWQ